MFTRDIEPHLRIAFHRAIGHCTVAEAVGSIAALYAHRDFRPDFNVIWDFREGTLDLHLVDFAHLGTFLTPMVKENRRAGGRTAFVAATPEAAAKVRTLQATNSWPVQWGVFDCLQSAIAWCHADGAERE